MNFTLADVYYLPIIGVIIGLTIVFQLTRICGKLKEITTLLTNIKDK